MYKDTFAADITKDKTPAELFDCIGNFFYDLFSKNSYQITGVGKDCFICTRVEIEHDYDDESPWGYTVHRYLEVKFTENKNYVYSLPPTIKQKEWLKKHDLDDDRICGVEAWHIIHDTIEKARKKRNHCINNPDVRARRLGFRNDTVFDAWLTGGTFEINGMDISDDYDEYDW